MARKREDYLINLLITSQNLAEGDLKNLGKELDDLEQQVSNLNQSERQRTDTLTAAQRENAKVSKQNQELLDQSKEAVKVNEKEVDSIDKKTKAVKEETNAFGVFFSNFEKSIEKIKRDLNQKKIDIDITAAKASITEVTETLNNLEKASKRRGLSEDAKKDINAQIERLKTIKKSYQQELDNLNITKQAIRVKEEQRKVEESLGKEREKAESIERRRLSQQSQAIKQDRILADSDRKKAKAKKELIVLLSKETEMQSRLGTGRQVEIAKYEEWEESVKRAKRQLEEFGATQQEIDEIENNAVRSSTERRVRLAKARDDYSKAIEKEKDITSESVALDSRQITQLEVLRATKERAREEIEALGGSYSDLDRSSNRSAKQTEKNIRTIDKLRNVLRKARGDGDDSRRSPLASFVIAFRNAGDEAGILSRRLGRLGLAIRGLVIVGLLAFMQSFISVVGALGAQITALISSILSASAAIGISLTSAIAQAIPVVGLLAAAFSRISAIQEAVNQADLARKQAFGDTGSEEAATDAALQIADAQKQVKEAQEGVTEARKEAKKELQDLILKEKEAELAFKSATLSQLEARRALKETIASGDVESVGRDQLGIEESNLDVIRSRRELRQARQARRQGKRGGVEGTETYKNAIKSLAAAQKNLAQAQRSAASSADTQSAAQRNLAFFLNELSVAERKLFKQFMRVKERYEKVFRPITDIIIRAFSRGLGRAEKLIFSSGIVEGFRNLARVLGNSLDRVAKVLAGPEFKAFFVEMLRQAANNMPVVTSGFILLARIFKEMALAAGPAFSAILEFIVEKLGEFNNTVSDTSSFSEFLMMGVEHFEAWIELIISILGLLGQIMQASSNSAIETITSLTETINGAKESLQADDSGARTFFDDAAQSMKEIGRVILALGAAIVELTSSKQVKALADIFTEMLIPGMIQGIKVVGLFALGLDKLLENDLFAKIMQFGVSLFFVYSAFSAISAIFLPGIKLITGLGTAFGVNAVFIKNFVSNLGIVKSVSEALSKAWFFSNKPAGFLGILKSIPAAVKNAGGIFMVLRKGLAAIPVVGWAVALVIEAIIGAIAALKDNFLGITDMMGEALGGLGEAFNNLFSAFGGAGGGGGFGVVLDVLGKILGVIGDIIGFIGKLIGFVVLITIIEAVIKPLTFIVNTIADIIEVWSTFVGDIKKDGLGKAILNLGKNIARGFGRLIGRLLALLLRLPILAVKGLVAAVKAVWSGIKGLFKIAVRGVIGLGKFILNTLKFIFSPKSILNTLSNVINTMGNFFKSLPSMLLNILKAAGKAIWEGLVEGIGSGTAEKVVNFFIGVLNTIIDQVNSAIEKINKVNPFGDISYVDKIEEIEIKEKKKSSQGRKSATDSGGRGRSRDIDDETKSQNKNNKSKKDAAKSNLGNYKALNMVGGASKQNIKLNNQLAGSLDKSSRQHKRAQNLQEELSKAAARGRRQQNLYAESVRQTTRVEERYANSLARARRIKADTNDKDRASTKIRERMADSTKVASNAQRRYYTSTIKSTAANTLFNKTLRRGSNLQEDLAAKTKKTANRTDEHKDATLRLSKRLGRLNKVLSVTGQNSRALGVVFKQVTNRLLKEFNVKPLAVELPSVDGMFKDAMGGSQNFQRGGYFGNKGMRGPDDRTIMVAGGEAILTGNHQAAVDTAFTIANQTAGFPYQNLDSMFNKDKRPHASAKRYNTGGKIPGFNRGGRNRSGRGNIVIPSSVPDADGALPGLDLMAWMLSRYFGLSLTDGLRNSNYGSDHEWGGAIDVSNGSNPTPQMDSAWFWLTRVLGGAKAGSFVEDYRGGAIKQMLYRTNIGGNHFNHIHLALLESYARNVEQLTKILTGQAIPVATGGAMFAAAPQLKKPKIKTNNKNQSIQKMLQGQSDRLTKGANKYLNANIVPAGGGINYAPTTAAIEPGSKIRTGYTVYDDSPPGSFGPLDNGYAELGTATTAGLTGGGYMAQAFGLAGELPENFPVDVQINGKTKRLYKRDRGWGQGTSDYGIDIWQDSWGFFGLNANSSGQAIVTAANKQKKKGKPGPKYQVGGNIPEFDQGGIVPGKLGEPTLIKAHGGELVLPTHKYNTGGIVPKYQSGGAVSVGVPDTTIYSDVKNKTGRRALNKLQKEIKKLTKKLNKEKNQAEKNILIQQIAELKDQIMLSKEVKAYNKEINDLRKQIKKKEKDIRKASDDKKKELKKELGKLKKELSQAKKDKKATVAFEGELYNTNNIQEFILLISDRIKSFMKKLEEGIAKIALATAKWTYKPIKINGEKIITKTASAVKEATRALTDLLTENELIKAALAEATRGQRKARAKLKKTRQSYNKKINKEQKGIDKDRETLKDPKSTKAEKEEAKKSIKERKKNIKKLRKDRKDDIGKLEASIKNSNNAAKELAQQLADNLAAIYEQQIAVFEEKIAEIDSQISRFDTQAEIATIQNTTSAGNLTTAGKEQLRSIYTQRGTALENQAGIIRAELEKVKAAGDVQRTQELEQALLENRLAVLQNTQSINELDTALEDALAEISSRMSMFDTQAEIITLLNTSTAGNLSQQGKDLLGGIFEQRATALEEQRRILEEQLAKAREENDIVRVRELEQALLDNQLAVLQNTKSILELDTRLEDALSEISSRMSMFDTQIEIAKLELADRQGNLNEEGRAVVRGIYQQRGVALMEQAEILREQLANALAEGDVIRSRELEQAILENRLALLQNTKSIEELDNSIGGIFDFRSTNWEQFRQAVFSNGNILPSLQTNIPQLASGGYVKREGLAYLHAAEVVTPASKTGNKGPFVDTINFTQPMEVADPVAISNQIGFKLSTLKSL